MACGSMNRIRQWKLQERLSVEEGSCSRGTCLGTASLWRRTLAIPTWYFPIIQLPAGTVTCNRVGKAVQIFVFDLVLRPPAMMISGSLHACDRGEKFQSTTRPCNTATPR